jgi:hypothetical protein
MTSAPRSTSWLEKLRWKKRDNAMAKTTWGRKETIVWRRHMPIYTYGVRFAAVALTFVFFCVRVRFGITPLQRYYLPAYERTSVVGPFILTHRVTYRILFVAGRDVPLRPVMDGDVVIGKTPEPDGKAIRLRFRKRPGNRITPCSSEARSGSLWMLV